MSEQEYVDPCLKKLTIILKKSTIIEEVIRLRTGHVMKILLVDWNSYGNKSIEALFRRRGYEVMKAPYEEKGPADLRKARAEDFAQAIQSYRPDYVFSFNYFPVISNLCQERHIPYLSWIYDSPFLDIYSYTVLNEVNRIVFFDGGIVADFAANRILRLSGPYIQNPGTGYTINLPGSVPMRRVTWMLQFKRRSGCMGAISWSR